MHSQVLLSTMHVQVYTLDHQEITLVYICRLILNDI